MTVDLIGHVDMVLGSSKPVSLLSRSGDKLVSAPSRVTRVNIRIAIVDTHAAPAARKRIPGDLPSPLYN